ncbi:acetyl-CoA synthetase-like protein [Hypoxylon sp. NC1633]|nr:acetyl-CoA synthetase-like protein [Hypoxylon sp. NC1633]
MAGFHELIPHLLKRRINEKRPLLKIVSPDNYSIDITFAVLDNAVNRAAWFLTQNLGEHEETFIWMSKSDARYIIWAIAAMKTGKVAVFPSLSNRVSANLRLFDTVGAKHMFYGPEASDILADLISQASSTVTARPGLLLDDIVCSDPVPDYPFDWTYEEIKHKRFMGLHTSGTSGHPKPIWWTHAHFECLFSPLEEGVLPKGAHVDRPTCSTLANHDVLIVGSQSHAGAMYLTMVSLRAEMTAILMHPDLPIIPTTITAVINQTGANSMICPPVPIENMLNYRPGVDALRRLKHVGYVGGPINPIHGARIAEITPHLYSLIGSTEGALLHMDYSPDSTNWDALRFVDVGQRMDEVYPGLYELVFPKTEDIDRLYSFWRSYTDLETEYRTKDLFAPVPGQEGWWRYRGRTDNWVAMANGYKMDPSDFEAVVASHPDVKGVIVGGSHRFRLCLLVELHEHLVPTTDAQAHDALEKLWPKIHEANASAPKFGQIPRELVLFTANPKPFLRTGKGTVQRQLTLQAYEAEIDALYERVESGILVNENDLGPIASLAPADLEPVLAQLFRQALDAGGAGSSKSDADVGPETDIFARGLDSNGVTITISRLKAALRAHGVSEETLRGINMGLMYSATTARGLAPKLSTFLLGGGGSSSSRRASHAAGDGDGGVSAILDKYVPLATSPFPRPPPQCIVVTGTTGSLGTYLLAALQAQPASRVRRIFCLNRAPDAAAKQARALASRGLPPADGKDGRVVFLTVRDLAAPRLGLADEDYDVLSRQATAIIHNAWPVNFLLPLASFEPSIAGLAALLRLAHESRRKAPLLFVSSIAAAMGGGGEEDGGAIPEAVVPDPARLALRQGYARSKYVGERLVDAYARATGRRAAVLRVGQVAGPVGSTENGGGGGVWNEAEWFPSLVRSSRYLGVLPRSLGSSSRVEWVPVDELSRIVLEVVEEVTGFSAEVGAVGVAEGEDEDEDEGEVVERGSGSGRGATVYNLVNPTPVPFSALLPTLLDSRVAPRTTSLESWIEALERSSHAQKTATSAPASADDNPAVKLLDFYKSLVPRRGGGGAVVNGNGKREHEHVNGDTGGGKAKGKGEGEMGGGGEDDFTWRVDNMLRASPSARALKPVNGDWVKLWVERWGF